MNDNRATGAWNAIGIGIGVAMSKIGPWLAIGVVLGVVVGAAVGRSNRGTS